MGIVKTPLVKVYPTHFKTLAERFKDWFRIKVNAEVKFQNPANIKLGACIKIDLIDFIDPLDEAKGLVQDLEFEVKEVQIYRRRDIKSREWVDYLLESEINTGEVVSARLRVQSRDHGELVPVFLQLWDTVAFDEGFESVLEDCDKHKSLFSIDVLGESYTRCAGLGEPSCIDVTRYSDLDSSGVVTESEVQKNSILYRDFVLKQGQENKLLFIEQDTESMEAELWRGRVVLFSEIHV